MFNKISCVHQSTRLGNLDCPPLFMLELATVLSRPLLSRDKEAKGHGLWLNNLHLCFTSSTITILFLFTKGSAIVSPQPFH